MRVGPGVQADSQRRSARNRISQRLICPGRKDRPGVIALAVERQPDGETLVIIPPITHLPTNNSDAGIEIPRPVKWRLGLEDARSWVIVSEGDQFVWPGYNLRKLPGTARSRIWPPAAASLLSDHRSLPRLAPHQQGSARFPRLTTAGACRSVLLSRSFISDNFIFRPSMESKCMVFAKVTGAYFDGARMTSAASRAAARMLIWRTIAQPLSRMLRRTCASPPRAGAPPPRAQAAGAISVSDGK